MFFLWLGVLGRTLQSRQNLILENLALRQQLAVLKRRHTRPRLNGFDKLFWVVVRRWWWGWKNALIAVTPETVVRWHRAGFHWYWRMISKVRNPVRRRPTSKEVRGLIFQMVADNPTWGAPRIHGELLMLGFDVSKRTISRWMKRAPRDPEPGKRWLAFLRNHREAIAAMDASRAHFSTSSSCGEPTEISLHEKPVATGNSPWLSSAPELRSRGRDYFPNFAPITSPDTMISTRRFSLRPAAVLLSATGFS